MDPPYIHQSRYVPISSPPSNPNLYRPQIYHQPSSSNYLPPPPPPQLVPLPHPPQQLRRHHHHHHLPPPPPPTDPPPVTKVSFGSQHSPFQFSPNFSPSHSPNPNAEPQNQYHYQRINDFGRRISINDDRQQHHQRHDHHHLHHRQGLVADFDSRPYVWDRPPKILPDNRPVVSNLDHHQFDHRPMSPFRPTDKIKHDLDTSYRFRESYSNDGVQFEYKSGNNSSQWVDFVPHRRHVVSNSDRLNSSSYDNQNGSQFDSNELIRNNMRDTVLDRQVLRERESRDSFFGRGSNSENGGDGVRAFSGKREFYGSDSGRYGNNRGSRENSHEYNRTPRKQVQKKSALLRIQKPFYRSRDDGDLHYSGFEMKSGSFRGKDQVVFSEREVGEDEQIEGSPVELDVSFKSNSLVAKAIVAPSRSAIVSDANLTPKKGNTRKIMMSDKDHSSSPMKKPLNSSRNLDGSRDAVNNALVSDNKDAKLSEKKVAPSGANVHDTISHPCSSVIRLQSYHSGSKNSPAKITVEKSKGIVPEKGGTYVGTTKLSSLKAAKKKKFVKKVVKKAINPMVRVSSSQPTEELDEPVKADGSTLDAPAARVLKMGVKPSKDKITSAAVASGHLGHLEPSGNEANMLPRNKQMGGSPQAAMVSKKVSPDGDSCSPCVTKIKRKRSGSLSHLASSSNKETKTDEGSVNADNCLHFFHTALNTDKDLTKLLNETNFSDVGGVEGADNQFCHNGHSLLLENADTKVSPETMLSEGRNIISDLLSLEENRRHEGLVNTCSFAQGTNTTTISINGLLSSQEKMTHSDIGILNSFSKQPCKGQMSPLVNRSTVEGFPLVIPPGRCEIFALSSSEETGIHNVSTHADCTNPDKCRISGSDNVKIGSEEISPGTGDFNDRQLARNEVTVSLENGVAEGFPNTMFSVGSSEEDMSKNTDKSKVMMPLSDLPDAMTSDLYMSPVKAVSSAQSMNSTLYFSVKECCNAELRVTEALDAGVQSCSGGLSVFHGYNSTGGCCEANVSDSSDLNGPSPENRRRRKCSSSHPGFSSMIVSEISEGPVAPDLSASGVELPSNSNMGLIQPEEGLAVSNMDTLCDSSLPSCPDGITVLLENSSTQVSSEVAVSVSRDASGLGDDSLKAQPQRADSSSAFGESDTAIALFPCPPGSESKQVVNENPVLDVGNYKTENNGVMCMENNKTENTKAFVEEKVKACSEATEFGTPPELQSPDLLNQILPAADVVSDGCLFEKGDLSSASTYRTLTADGDGISTTNYNDELTEFDSLSRMGSPDILSTVPVMRTLNHEASTSLISNEKVCGIDKIPNEKPVDEGTSNLSSHTSPSEHAKINLKLDYLLESAHLVAGRTVSLSAQDVKGSGHNVNPMSGETYRKKNQPSHSVSRIPPRRSSSVFTASRNVASSTRTTNPRTWHRTESSSAVRAPGNKSFLRTVLPPNQLPEKIAKFQRMSYIRKGNSLVRKPAPVAALPQVSHGLTSSVYRLNSSGIGESKKTRGSESSSDVIDPPNFLRMGVTSTSERSKTPPLPVVAKVPNHATNSKGDCTSSPVAEPLPNGCSDTTSDPQKLVEINDELNSSNAALNISETPVKTTGSVNSLESQDELDDGTLSTLNVKRITYLKRNSNQLIAASNDCGLSVQNPENTQSTTSDGYYKRRKNQLIRTPLESHINLTVSSAVGSFISEGRKGLKDIYSRSSNKNQYYKAVKKIRKPLRFSLVWTLNGMQSSKNDDRSSYRQKVLPYLFPWKRTVYGRRFAQDSVSFSNNSSLSAISRKLRLLRKRDAIYTRSNRGFSLRKSKVLSVGGSSLKWSKSLENRSKIANEEATLAVAAVEKKKQNGAESFASEIKNRSRSCRERIFRVGSVRYKMDSSRRTLQRISDDESSCAAAPNSEKNAKKSYIPRRLVIGNDEYVRIGNGNQLIRDPKKRARVLASEKVRWSLHTARLRLARKRKYCQFFTRFGKCNKDNGKCPYIHDPSKIAVCTKFLNGLCFNSDCKLTHKVIPDRMPDCSYFLQGLCTNKKCPYRHVHVNPSASTCEGFLRGYCADGNECRKKHSYVCPTFESTGSCPLGSKCKLHHPKSRSKGKKNRRSKKPKKTHGRYFGSMLVEDSEPQIIMSERHSIQDNGNFLIEGKLADYIELDGSDEEAGEANDALHEPITFNDSDASDLQLDDLDELIKPIRLLRSPIGSFLPG